MFMIIAMFYSALNKEKIYTTENQIGKKISSFKLESLNKKKIITESDLLNKKFTLINFWASWCAPCRLEHKYLILLKKNSNLNIIGINFKDNKKNANSFLEQLSNPYDFIGKDYNGKVSVLFGVYGIPESILIDEQLNIKKKFIGPLNESDYNIINQFIKLP